MPNLVIVSNRLPVVVKKVNGKLNFSPGTGGIATGLSSYAKRRGTKWIGWPGLASDDLTEADRAIITRELRKRHCYPVFLTQKEIDEFYSGYSNGVLWPLMHDLPFDPYPAKWWRAYREVNGMYAEEALRLSPAGSTIWVHDYQLMLVPELLRQASRGDRIGFFLHIPFPLPNTFRKIGESKKLLGGILGADLAGFHTRRYTQHFVANSEQLAGALHESGQLLKQGRRVTVTEFPMGIDYAHFSRATRLRANQERVRKLRQKYRGKKVIVSVDRLDLTKGLVERVKAFQTLLRQSPKFKGKVVMVMIVAPSRTDVPAYQRLKTRLDKALAAVQKEFGTDKWQPIEFIYETVPLDDVITYYQMADVAFIAPIIDGMNLVAKEFIASRPKHDGVLVLSETAGAAEELRDAIRVNPAKPDTMVDGLRQALALSKRELERRALSMQKQVQEFTVQKWATNFMNTLQRPRTIKPRLTLTLTKPRTKELVQAYQQASRRLLMLDYDGVLRSFEHDPAAATPTKSVLQLLKRLGSDPATDIMIISGRSKADLQSWFGSLPIALAAEHGALIRRKGGKNWHHTSSSSLEWRRHIIKLFEFYADMTPGARVEQKEWAVVWHYRAASAYHAQKNLVALRRLLKPISKQHGLQILEGNKVLEVRPNDVSKRHAVQEWVISDHDFMLCVGDDVTDEDMFKVMPPYAYSIKVGRGPTRAHYRVKNVDEVLELLSKF